MSTATPPSDSSDQSLEEPTQEKNDYCSSPCYKQQLLVFIRLIGFAADYIDTDVTGYRREN